MRMRNLLLPGKTKYWIFDDPSTLPDPRRILQDGTFFTMSQMFVNRQWHLDLIVMHHRLPFHVQNTVTESKSQRVKETKSQRVKERFLLSSCHLVNLSNSHPVSLSSFQSLILSTSELINLKKADLFSLSSETPSDLMHFANLLLHLPWNLKQNRYKIPNQVLSAMGSNSP